MVRAVETTLQELLEGSRQYQVPLYQRTYSWKQEQLRRLWDDVVKLATDRAEGGDAATHFVGSVVLAPSPNLGPAGVQEFLVVDGQQRLTTLSILLCAIRDHRAESEDPMHRDRVNEQFLINKWKPGDRRLKVLPTQADRASYLACVDATPQAGGGDGIGAAYRFFRARLTAADDPDDPNDIERIEDAVIRGLSVVSVTAQAGDNVHRIFESLNNTGLRLTQGDLLRNYLFMRLPERGEVVYNSLWLPLQQALTAEELELLFWLDLVQSDPRAKQTEIYAGQQTRLARVRTEEELEKEVARFARLGGLLKTILDPARENDPHVARRLRRLNAWGTTTVYPLLLHLLDRRDRSDATSEQLARSMSYVEAFFVRRLLIGRATANINRILLAVVTEMKSDVPVDEAVRRYLSTGRKYYATDDELRSAIRTIPFYLNGRPIQRNLVLRWLEETLGSKEPINYDGLQIEHVLPQSGTPEWRRVIREDCEPGERLEDVYEGLVHTLGNLTLTGYNPKLSNSSFGTKRKQLAQSGLLMNHEIAEQKRWGRPQIVARANLLADRAVKLWPGPIDGVGDSVGSVVWDSMAVALAELPSGAWTTYGDVAALIGSHPVPVGVHLANHRVINAHRVLQAEGTISPSFRWLEPGRDDDPMDLLKQEGVEFDHRGRANPAQRVTTEELAELSGLRLEDLPDSVTHETANPASDPHDRFIAQLDGAQDADTVHGILAVLDAWTALGGRLEYGRAAETSCFLMTGPGDRGIWPAAIYPSGKFEVVFQHLAVRGPFDDLAMREELRLRLNAIPGVDLPASKIEMRPGFSLAVAANDRQRELLIDALRWFQLQVQAITS